MNFKKALTVILIFTLILAFPINSSLPVIKFNSNDVYADGVVTIYAPDGRTAQVYESQVSDYIKLGWFRTFEEITTTVYAPDGRSILVYNSDLSAYLSLGWYDSFEQITSTLYAPDGRTVTVYKTDVPSYLALGWYSSYEEVTEKLYAPDGRTIVVYKSEVTAYENVGWRRHDYVDPSKPMVALSFDDGPSAQYTKRIVDTLIKYNAKATFFVVGEFLQKNSDITKYAYDNGMEIANHTYTHVELPKHSAYTIQKEIENTSAEIQIATGNKPTLFRPPYGSTNSTVKSTVGMPQILWSIDTLDWKSRNAQSVFDTVADKVKDGDIILMHDLYKSTADAVDMIVPHLIENGFQIVSVSTLAKCKGYVLQPGEKYYSFR